MSTPLYNSSIIDTYIKLIKSKYNFVNVGELLSYANMTYLEVSDQGHWFSQEQVNLFYEKLLKVTGNENIAREAGRYAASPEAMGIIRQYFLGLVGPAKAYSLIGEAANTKIVRSSIYASRQIASNSVEITVTPRPGTHEEPFQCQNRMGFFEAVASVFNAKLPHIEHPECMFKGDRVCRYIVSWDKAAFTLRNHTRNAAGLFLLALTGYFLKVDPATALRVVAPWSITAFLALTLISLRSEKKALILSQQSLVNLTDSLFERVEINYNNALVTNEIGQAISRLTEVHDILSNVIQILEKRLDYSRGLILLSNPEKSRLVFQAGFGYHDEQLAFLGKTTFHLDRPDSKGVFVISFREQRPFLVADVKDIEGNLSGKSQNFAKQLLSQTFICCPIICEGESLGIIAVDNLKSKRPLVQSDVSLLMGIAPVIGISIRNAKLHEAKSNQFSSFLKVMAASIDARDPLTAGHSEKVTEYSEEICEELGLPRNEREMIRVAALLHDYGKIGVPDAILKKNGRLSDLEYEIVKTHCHKTRDILEQVNFEGIYREVPEIAGAHHEKIDGTGYPKGLKGKNIPLGAKIIAVADFYEAVTSQRHYRAPMPREDAFRLLREGAGSHFDKHIVDALIACRTRANEEDTSAAQEA
ncbi:HD domain-containing phosphohydrolase [Geomonas anaerohicana]|uniref:HD domain-containing protein n=1 Tax=Geomonas anaerohicana TaxID=2798583 RepID=A0ABS0YDX7_9BACT|nr:HD domain-containing phosphohydrolase [Geomonas anaerohicana]MBJ6750344.1 HD domain-containing protein [Geomonas anaerohicana]